MVNGYTAGSRPLTSLINIFIELTVSPWAVQGCPRRTEQSLQPKVQLATLRLQGPLILSVAVSHRGSQGGDMAMAGELEMAGEPLRSRGA